MYQNIECKKKTQCDHETHQFILTCINPSLFDHLYDGEMVVYQNITYCYRSFQAWFNLAEELQYYVHNISNEGDEHIQITLSKRPQHSWHQHQPSGHPEKYGYHSEFKRINKLEEPSFLMHFRYALQSITLPPQPSVLILGVNQGHEITALHHLLPLDYTLIHGIDHSASIIEYAQKKFHIHPHVHLQVGDIRQVENLALTQYDLIVSINTLHSPLIDGQKVVRTLVKSHLNPQGALILGFPQSRYQDKHLSFGLRTPKANTVDLAKVLKGIYAHQRYLQQHQYKVEVIGKYTALLIAQQIKHR